MVIFIRSPKRWWHQEDQKSMQKNLEKNLKKKNEKFRITRVIFQRSFSTLAETQCRILCRVVPFFIGVHHLFWKVPQKPRKIRCLPWERLNTTLRVSTCEHSTSYKSEFLAFSVPVKHVQCKHRPGQHARAYSFNCAQGPCDEFSKRWDIPCSLPNKILHSLPNRCAASSSVISC